MFRKETILPFPAPKIQIKFVFCMGTLAAQATQDLACVQNRTINSILVRAYIRLQIR